MKSPQERGRYGRWLVASREARGYGSTAAARKAMADAGITIAHSTYAEYEAGTKPPSKNHLPQLERFWGPVDAFEAQAPAASSDPVIAAMDRQTAAIEAQTAMLERMLLVIASRTGSEPVGPELLEAAAQEVAEAEARLAAERSTPRPQTSGPGGQSEGSGPASHGSGAA